MTLPLRTKRDRAAAFRPQPARGPGNVELTLRVGPQIWASVTALLHVGIFSQCKLLGQLANSGPNMWVSAVG
jgi:hypothetical protein